MARHRLPRACHAVVVAAALFSAPLSAPHVGAQSDDLACQQQPGNRFFWLERAFCDRSTTGAERANGVVIWNHGISGTTQAWMAPAPPVFRLVQARGWDVIMLKRHHAAETENVLYRTVQRTLQEAAAFRKAGYRKVVLAGQSFGGYVSLEAIDTSPDIDAAIAFAPGVRSQAATGRLDSSIIERILQRAKVGRLALVFPKDDALFGYQERGQRADTILSRRTIPYLLVDETSDVRGHGGAVTGRFALRYGACLTEFLAVANLPAGRFTCPPANDDWALVRELLVPTSGQRPSFMMNASGLSVPLGALTGPRWALLEDTVVLVAPMTGDAGRVRLLYRSTGMGGGIFDATIQDGVIRAVLSNKSTVTLKPGGDGTITWTASDGSRSLSAPWCVVATIDRHTDPR